MPDALLAAKLEQSEAALHQAHRHLDLLTSISVASTEPGGVEHLVRRSLEIICRTNNWVLGQFWIISAQENVATCSEWYFSSAVLTPFRSASLDRRLSNGIGLPGRVWSTGLPLLISEIESESGFAFTRKAIATKSGITSAFGFPVKNGPFVTGVCEFFTPERIQLDAADMRFYEKLGSYLATVIAQREADRAVRQNELLNRIALNHAYNAFIAITETSLITEWTSRATDLFGWEKDEVIGKPLPSIIIPERYRDAHVKGLFRYLTTNEGPALNRPVQAPALHKNGSEIPVELLIFPIEGLDVKRFGAFIVDRSNLPKKPEIILE